MEVFELIIDGIGHGIEWLQIVKLGSVSLWQILCGSFILSALIVGLLNVVKTGTVSYAVRASSDSERRRNKQ